MNIGLITEKYPPDAGGLAISAQRLAQMLVGAGHRLRVFVPSSDLEPGQLLVDGSDGLMIYRLGARRRVDDTLEECFDLIVSQNRNCGFDLLHGYFLTQAGFLATYAGAFLGVPSVASMRGNDLDRAIFDPAKAAHIFYVLQNAGALTANTREQVRKANALAPGRPVILVANGVDAARFQPRPRSAELAGELGLGDLPVVGFVGEARAKKGLAALLLAFRALVNEIPAALLLAGGVRSGEDKDLLKVFMKQNPDLKVVVTPYLPPERLPAIYSLIDVLALPSLHDGLPNALLEGMACERAVVATPVGGMADVLADGENGRLVQAGDVDGLAAALQELLGDVELRKRLGIRARATVVEGYTPEQELAGYLEVYRQVGAGLVNDGSRRSISGSHVLGGAGDEIGQGHGAGIFA